MSSLRIKTPQNDLSARARQYCAAYRKNEERPYKGIASSFSEESLDKLVCLRRNSGKNPFAPLVHTRHTLHSGYMFA